MHVWLVAAMSADGKIAKRSDQLSLDWTSKEDTQFFVQKTKEAGAVIMGRKTFSTIGQPLKDRLVVVMTRSLDGVEQQEGVLEFTDETPEEILKDLEERGYENVVVAGGGSIYSLFLQKGLVNEVYLTVEPYLFGSGIPLAEGFEWIAMELEDVVRLGDRSVLLHYHVAGSL